MFIVKYNLKCSSFFLRNVSKFLDLFLCFFFKRIYSYFIKRYYLFFFIKKKLGGLLNSYRSFIVLRDFSFFCSIPRNLFSHICFRFYFLNSSVHIRSFVQRFFLSSYKFDFRLFFLPTTILFSDVFYSLSYSYRSFFVDYIHFFKFVAFLFYSSKLFSFVFLPLKIKKFVFLKSPHVHKKARDQLEIRTHRFLLIFLFFDLILQMSSFLTSLHSDFGIILFKTFYNYEAL